MAYDYITHSKRIEEYLRQTGLSEAADLLSDARLSGATSGEILMALRFTLRRLISSGVLVGPIRDDAGSLVDEINKSGV
jgi:hypothetical protein